VHDRARIPFTAHTGEIVGGIAGALLFISVLVVLILYRNWKYEQELDSLLWKVNYKDIEVKEKKDEAAVANETPAKCTSKVSACTRFSFPRSFTSVISTSQVQLRIVESGGTVS
jgi:hypothetical protein